MRHPLLFKLSFIAAFICIGAAAMSLFYLVGLNDRMALNDGALVIDSHGPFANHGVVPLRTSRLPWPAILRKSLVPSVYSGPYRDPNRPPGVHHFQARIPLWIPATGFSILALWLYRTRRRSPTECRHCAYDLKGNLNERCPECGHHTTTTTPAQQ